MVLQLPGLVPGVEIMKERKEKERRMGHGIGGLARRTDLSV